VAVEVICPRCGEREDLRGERRGETVVVRCGRCGHEWARDRDVCPRCGRRSLADRREPLIQKARGTQQSIVGYRIVQECWGCGYGRD
jgi:RNA polymerase subunit RPABC4/transcription elongation factor Spt4